MAYDDAFSRGHGNRTMTRYLKIKGDSGNRTFNQQIKEWKDHGRVPVYLVFEKLEKLTRNSHLLP
jgi:hypothetical protein